MDDLVKVIEDDTALVSIMYANNEIGNIFPVMQIGEMLRDREDTVSYRRRSGSRQDSDRYKDCQLICSRSPVTNSMPQRDRRAVCKEKDEVLSVYHRWSSGKGKACRHGKYCFHNSTRKGL